MVQPDGATAPGTALPADDAAPAGGVGEVAGPVEVVTPTAEPARTEAAMAPAPAIREGLRIALLSNGKVNGSELLAAIGRHLAELVPAGLELRHYRKPSVSVPPDPADFEEIVDWADAAICAIGDCGSCSSRTMRDAIDLEWAGIPAVPVIADALVGPVDYMRRLSGMPDYPFTITAFPVGNLTPAETDERGAQLAPEVLRLLTTGRPEVREAVTAPSDGATTAPAAGERQPTTRFASEEAALEGFFANGWTDGLPVVIPTPARVAAMVAAGGRAPEEILFTVPTRNDLTITVELAAANAVMAGCSPALFPVVLAAADALGTPASNMHAHTATLSGAQQVVIVNGPVRERLGINSGEGALGPGTRANATIGRAVRLIVRNGCHSVHGEFDRATFSHPGRYSWCFGEAEEHSPWAPLTADAGLEAGTDAVSIYATVWQASTIFHGRDAEELLDEVGLVARTACHANWLHAGFANDNSFFPTRPFLFVIGRQHAEVLLSGGYADKAAVQEALFSRLTDDHPTLRAASVADAQQIHVVYVHGTGFQQTLFLAPFQSHELVTVPIRPAADASPGAS